LRKPPDAVVSCGIPGLPFKTWEIWEWPRVCWDLLKDTKGPKRAIFSSFCKIFPHWCRGGKFPVPKDEKDRFWARSFWWWTMRYSFLLCSYRVVVVVVVVGHIIES
jgi:hypothetical protein